MIRNDEQLVAVFSKERNLHATYIVVLLSLHQRSDHKHQLKGPDRGQTLPFESTLNAFLTCKPSRSLEQTEPSCRHYPTSHIPFHYAVQNYRPKDPRQVRYLSTQAQGLLCGI